ncbi:2-succinyl-6-hydroxy-2,4-cyclohexadiene-1-carboxylate synthase [Bacillus sp. NPDC077027]|uniref:2-succinyl-6-hydroxy-2, 4-cyclohexadiene-1-carboxylate synthase n=1 Tax=Bacillus sp. NPDC077027 TaxID=3390548 RepID=UPI003D0694AC
MAQRMIELRDGVKYEVWDQHSSSEEAILFLHGFTGNADSWHFIDEDLKDKRLVKVSLLGHGKTDVPQSIRRYAMSQQLTDLAEILDHLKLHKVNVVGYSMGGRIALALASTYPERVAKLVLESTSPGLATLKERKARLKHDSALARKLRVEGLSAFVDFWENIPLFASQKLLPVEQLEKMRAGRLRSNPLGLARSLQGIGTGSQPSMWSTLKLLKMPTLLVCGALDHKFCDLATRMEKELITSRVVCVDHTGHTVHVEQSQLFGKIVREFILNHD